MSVSSNAPVRGKNLPLVVMSHGNGGSLLSRFDTAIALADAGFVVVAVTHTGDNYADQSRNLNVMGRSRHISRCRRLAHRHVGKKVRQAYLVDI